MGSTRYSGNHFPSYKIISVTPKRLLKTQIFEKKDNFPAKKLFRPIFSRIIEYGELQRTFYRGPKGFLTAIVQVIRSFRLDLRGRRKKFSKRRYFADEKLLG